MQDQEKRNEEICRKKDQTCATCRYRLFLMGMIDACCGNKKSDHFGRVLGDQPHTCDKHERPE